MSGPAHAALCPKVEFKSLFRGIYAAVVFFGLPGYGFKPFNGSDVIACSALQYLQWVLDTAFVEREFPVCQIRRSECRVRCLTY